MSWIYDLPPLTHADPRIWDRRVENSSALLLVLTEDREVFEAWYSGPREMWLRPYGVEIKSKIIAYWRDDDASQDDQINDSHPDNPS